MKKLLLILIFIFMFGCNEKEIPVIEEEIEQKEVKKEMPKTDVVGIDPLNIPRYENSIRYEYVDENFVSYYKDVEMEDILNFYINYATNNNLIYEFDIIETEELKTLHILNKDNEIVFSVIIDKTEEEYVKWTITK